MSRIWMLVVALLLVGSVVAGCSRRGGYCRRGGIIVPCACGYTYPHFAAPSFGQPGPVVPHGAAPDPYYSGQPLIDGSVAPSYAPPVDSGTISTPSLTPAPMPAPNLNAAPPVGSGTR